MARVDHLVIADMVPHGAKVLDVGCSDGALLELLARDKNAKGRGLEISQDGVNACVAKGLSVVQGDADRDLAVYPDRAFDVVVLSKTIQAVRNPRAVLRELMRVADRAIVSMPNFGHWKVRFDLVTRGRMPVTENLPAAWHESENIHLCTVRDFVDLAKTLGIHLERAVPIAGDAAGAPFAKSLWRANLFAEDVVFLLASR
ncbi:MAG: methionine biosynthesis protein MetW [Alphaproteobacteria bacterium]|jgi:methionine biosynthesis protein MetW|nr:methionine biosynthesis protein MetW [Alphaproteobacteria bacterium]